MEVLTAAVLLLLSVLSAQGTSVGVSRSLTNEEKCDILETALDRLWESLPDQQGPITSPFYRLSKPAVTRAFRLHTAPRGLPAEYTMDTDEGRRLIACRVAGYNNLAAIARQTRTPIGLVRVQYRRARSQWLQYGGAAGMRDMAEVLSQVNAFKQRTGLPNFPLQNTDEDEVSDFITELMGHRIIQLRFSNRPHPMLHDPSIMAQALMSPSRAEFLRQSGLSDMEFRGVEQRLQHVNQMVPIVNAVADIAQAMETIGFLDLE